MLLRSIKLIMLLRAARHDDFDDKLRSGYAVLQHYAPQHDRQIFLTVPAHTFNPNDSPVGSLRVTSVGNLKNYTLNFGCISLDILPR